MESGSGRHAAAERIRCRAIRKQLETLAAILTPHDKYDSTENILQQTIDDLRLLSANIDTYLTQINASSTEGKGTTC